MLFLKLGQIQQVVVQKIIVVSPVASISMWPGRLDMMGNHSFELSPWRVDQNGTEGRGF
jgi:hypothetical protein